jgi:hypothetical protein
MQFGEEQGWVTTTSYVLEDAAGAQAWVAWIDGDVWADCWLEKWQNQQDDAGSGAEVRIKTRENESLGTQGFESLLEAEVLDADGELVTIYSVQVFRIDRVVIHVSLTIGGMEDETYATFYAQYSEATSAAYDRVNALL